MEKFTQDLCDIIHQAQLEKDKLCSPYIDTVHLLLAMLKKHEGIKKYFKDNFDLTYEKYFNKTKDILGVGNKNEKYNIYTPLVKRILHTDDVSEYNINTLQVLYNIIDYGEGVAFRILIQECGLKDADINRILSDIEHNNIGEYYSNNLNLDNQPEIIYVYDILAAKQDNKHLIQFRKIPAIEVDDNILDILTSHIVSLDATSSLTFHLRASFFNENPKNKKTASTTALVIFNKKAEQGYIILFDYKNNILTTRYLSEIIPEELEEILDVFKNRNCYKLTDDNILSISNKHVDIYNAEQLYIDFQEKQKEKLEEDVDKSLNRQTGAVFKKMSCLSNVNERVLKHDTVIIGMEDELEQLIKGLMKFRKPNVMLKGEPGVGKTALVEKLADMINKKQVPKILQNKEIWELSMGSAVAGTKYRGEFEDKLNAIIKAAEENPNIILFIDEAHTMVGAGGAEGAIDASNILKPALARGDIKVIGATTTEEYDKYIKPDGALSRRFTTIDILEPLSNQVIDIMKGLVPKLEKFYNVTITNKIIEDLYNQAKMKKGMFPDIALDTMEEWCIKQSYSDYEEEQNNIQKIQEINEKVNKRKSNKAKKEEVR